MSEKKTINDLWDKVSQASYQLNLYEAKVRQAALCLQLSGDSLLQAQGWVRETHEVQAGSDSYATRTYDFYRRERGEKLYTQEAAMREQRRLDRKKT